MALRVSDIIKNDGQLYVIKLYNLLVFSIKFIICNYSNASVQTYQFLEIRAGVQPIFALRYVLNFDIRASIC